MNTLKHFNHTLQLRLSWPPQFNTFCTLVIIGGILLLHSSFLNNCSAQDKAQDKGIFPEQPPLSGNLDNQEPQQEPQHRQDRREMRKQHRENRRQGGPMGGAEGEMGGSRLGRMGSFLDVVQSFHGSVKDPLQAIGLATLGIKEMYRKQGKPLEAIPMLENALQSAKDQQVRNVLLFSIKQVYEDSNNSDKVLSLSKQIIQENMAELQKGH